MRGKMRKRRKLERRRKKRRKERSREDMGWAVATEKDPWGIGERDGDREMD